MKKGSPEEQHYLATHVAGSHRRVFETFAEIMSSHTPLSEEEIIELRKKRPFRYAALLGIKRTVQE